MADEKTPRTESAYPARLYRRRRNTRSKRQRSNLEHIKEQGNGKSPAEAVSLLKSCSHAKFDETVECCVHLGIDPKHADQQLRGALSMPKGVGKSARVICFCPNDKVDELKAAGLPLDFRGYNKSHTIDPDLQDIRHAMITMLGLNVTPA